MPPANIKGLAEQDINISTQGFIQISNDCWIKFCDKFFEFLCYYCLKKTCNNLELRANANASSVVIVIIYSHMTRNN